MGVAIVLLLGLVAGAFFHVTFRSFWIASALATATTAVLWIVGVSVLLAITAPNELRGPVLLGPILLIFGTSFVGAAVVGVWIRAVRGAGQPAGCCKGCGYDLTGNTSGVCPECGRAVKPAEGGKAGK